LASRERYRGAAGELPVLRRGRTCPIRSVRFLDDESAELDLSPYAEGVPLAGNCDNTGSQERLLRRGVDGTRVEECLFRRSKVVDLPCEAIILSVAARLLFACTTSRQRQRSQHYQ